MVYHDMTNNLCWSMLINNLYLKDNCLRMSEFLIINDFMEAAFDWILTNHQIPETLPGVALLCHMGSEVVVHSGGAHMTSQEATWRPPCGVRRVIQKHSQLYIRFKYDWNILFGLSMSLSTTTSTSALHFLFLYQWKCSSCVSFFL